MITALFGLVVCGALSGYYLWPGDDPAKGYPYVSTIAGSNREFGEPFGIAVMGREIYISDGEAGTIRVFRAGALSVFAQGFATPSAIAFNKAGDLIVADSGSHTIKTVNGKGEVSIIAGFDNQRGFADGDGSAALFNGPIGVAVNAAGRIFVADTYNDRIRVVENGKVSTLAGGSPGYADGIGTEAQFHTPTGVAVWQDKVLVADAGNRRVRVIESDGRVWTIAGDGSFDIRDGGLLTAAFAEPTGITVGPDGIIYVTDANSLRQIVLGPFPSVETISSKERGLADGPPFKARFNRPSCVAANSDGDLIIADSDNRLVRVLSTRPGHQITKDEIAGLPETAAEFRNMQPPRWPYDPPDAPRDVAGTLGELRNEIPKAKNPPRFHNGLDIAGSYGETARFVRTEKVLRPIAAENFGTLRELIRMPTMGYIHIRLGRDSDGLPFDDVRFQFLHDAAGKLADVRVPRGCVFSAGEAIGTLNAMNHIHLIAGRSGTEINALDALVLPGMTDNRPPIIEKTTVFDENWQPLETAVPNTRIKLSGKTRMVVRAFDQVDGNNERRRLGVYRVGYQLLTADLTPASDIKWTITFDRMPAAGAVEFAYAAGSRSGATGGTVFNYIATNTVEGDSFGEGFVDAAALVAGSYILRAYAADQAGNTAYKDIPVEVIK